MKPLLAHQYEPHRINYNERVWLQPKLNGVRALSQGGFFQSRDELPWEPGVLQHLSAFMRDAFPSDWVLDGELYVHGWPLQRINGAIAVNRKNGRDDSSQVEYHIFDRVSWQQNFEERFFTMMQYKGLFSSDTPVKIVETVLVSSEDDANDFYATQVARGYEGIMYRLGDCPYTRPKQEGGSGRSKFLSDKNNRVWHMLKRKDWHDDEFECIGVDEGLGKRAGKAGALVCKLSNGKTFGVGSGLTDAEAEHYLSDPPVGRKIRVKYLCLTSDGIPFNPTVIAVL
jgi:DNA ligase-1